VARFNLICHGMMLFVEEDTHIQILIPRIDEHQVRYGVPVRVVDPVTQKASCQDGTAATIPIPEGSWELASTGIQPGTAALSELMSPIHHVCIKSSAVTVQAGAEMVALRVPKPHDVFEYRAVDVTGRNILGTVPESAVVKKPRRVHDVVCLSYVNLADDTVINVGNWFSAKVGFAGMAWQGKFFPDVMSLCIWSQSAKPMANSHRTGLNDFLSINGAPTDLELSRIGQADDTPPAVSPHLKIDGCQLRNLAELFGEAHATDFTGCGSATVVKA
jgi:hypothetical protein